MATEYKHEKEIQVVISLYKIAVVEASQRMLNLPYLMRSCDH